LKKKNNSKPIKKSLPKPTKIKIWNTNTDYLSNSLLPKSKMTFTMPSLSKINSITKKKMVFVRNIFENIYKKINYLAY